MVMDIRHLRDETGHGRHRPQQATRLFQLLLRRRQRIPSQSRELVCAPPGPTFATCERGVLPTRLQATRLLQSSESGIRRTAGQRTRLHDIEAVTAAGSHGPQDESCHLRHPYVHSSLHCSWRVARVRRPHPIAVFYIAYATDSSKVSGRLTDGADRESEYVVRDDFEACVQCSGSKTS